MVNPRLKSGSPRLLSLFRSAEFYDVNLFTPWAVYSDSVPSYLSPPG